MVGVWLRFMMMVLYYNLKIHKHSHSNHHRTFASSNTTYHLLIPNLILLTYNFYLLLHHTSLSHNTTKSSIVRQLRGKRLGFPFISSENILYFMWYSNIIYSVFDSLIMYIPVFYINSLICSPLINTIVLYSKILFQKKYYFNFPIRGGENMREVLPYLW